MSDDEMQQPLPATPTAPTLQGSVGTAISAFPKRLSEMSASMRELEKQTFEIAFESLLEQVAGGTTLSAFCNEYHVTLQAARFRAWIRANPSRSRAFTAALAVGAEQMEDDILRISDGMNADGTASPNDVQRSQLMINTRRFLMTVRNRDKYADRKYVEQTTTTRFDPSTLSSDELQRRLMEKLGLDTDSFDFLEGEFGEDAQS